MPKKLLEIASEIVQGQLATTSMNSVEVTSSLRLVFQTLQDIQNAEAAGTALAPQLIPEEAQSPEASPAITPQDSIKEDKVICLECGAEMRQLTAKHLVSHGMSPKEYKRKYGLTLKTPLAAKSLTKARSKAAKKRGLPDKLKQFIGTRRKERAEAATTLEPSGPGTEEKRKARRQTPSKKTS